MLQESHQPYNVTITPSELANVSARELFGYLNESIVVTFNPGEIEKTVLLVINPDCAREGSEFFNLTLSPNSAAIDLGITLGDPSVAVAEIEDTDSKQITNLVCSIINCCSAVICVSFSHTKYFAEEADGVMIIMLQASKLYFRPYIIMVELVEHLPIGDPGVQLNAVLLL